MLWPIHTNTITTELEYMVFTPFFGPLEAGLKKVSLGCLIPKFIQLITPDNE